MEQVAHHLPLERREVTLGIGRGIVLVAIDRFFELIAQRVFAAVAEDQALQAAPDAVLVGIAVAGATSVLGHSRSSILAHKIGIGDAERGQGVDLDRLHMLGLFILHVVIA